MDAADERNRQLIHAKMTMWVKSCDELNAAARNFAPLYLCDYPETVIAEKEKNFSELQRTELDRRHDLARQIAFYCGREEFAHLDFQRPGQIIDWAIKEGRPRYRARLLIGIGFSKERMFSVAALGQTMTFDWNLLS